MKIFLICVGLAALIAFVFSFVIVYGAGEGIKRTEEEMHGKEQRGRRN